MSRQQLAQHAAHLEDLILQHADSLRMPNASVAAETVSNASSDCDRPALPKWCHAFGACNTTDVALVGNGPLTEEQQRELSSGVFQVVIRLNFMNNRAAGEQVDVWVMRNADDARLHFWGISQMERDSTLEAIAATKSLWFLGDINSEIDNYWHMMQPVYRHFPEVKGKHHVLLDFNHLTSPRGFEANMPKNDTVSPSSGWLGGLR
ncbi:g4137 [Coccomyxa elongata]